MNTDHKERHCWFIPIRGILDEAEKNDTNNKRSLHLSDYKEQGYLYLLKFAHFGSKFTSNESKNQFKLRIHKSKVKTWNC